jgi:prophage regulatory protein
MRQLNEKTGLGKSRVYELIAQEKFPPPVRLGPGSVAWAEDEIDAWIEARIAERDAKAKAPDERRFKRPRRPVTSVSPEA